MAENASPADEAGTGLHFARSGVRVVAALFAVASVVLVVWVVVARFVHPAEAEWMMGAMRDSVDRVKAGQPLYAAPSATHVAYIYPPLYFWLSGGLAKIIGTVVAARLVSIIATVVACVAIAKIAEAMGAARRWALAGAALYVGAYSYTMYCYDLERVDPLEAAVATSAIAVLLGGPKDGRSAVRAAVAGALLGLSYFAKQPGLFVFVAALGGLFAAREWRRLLVVGSAGLAVLVVVGGVSQAMTHGWFSYYVMKLPATHGIHGPLVTLFWFVDAPKAFALTAASFGVITSAVYRLLRRKDQPWRDVAFASVVGGAMIGAFLLRAHVGGWINVLIAWTPFGCAAAAVAASRAVAATDDPRGRAAIEIGLLTAFSLQLALWTFDPNEIAPGPKDDRMDAEFERMVKKLESEGEVLVSAAGGLTTPRHFHVAALYDVLRAGDPAPADYLAALRERKYAAMVLSVPNETMCAPASCAEASTVVMENYFVAARVPTPLRTSRVGFEARSTWILRPRKTPLRGLGLDKLDTRQRAEAAIAEMQSAVGGSSYDPTLAHADIEDAAATMVREPSSP